MSLNPQSTLNKLDVVNRVLQESGERTVAAITDNSAAWKVAGMLYSAITVVNAELPWDELIKNELLSSSNVTTESAPAVLNNLIGYNLNPVTSIVGEVVQLQNIATNTPVRYAEWHTLQNLGFVEANSPTYWTYYRGLLFTYPQIVVAERSKFAASFTGSIAVPALDNDVFDAPDYLVELYVKRLLYMFSQRHLGNPQFTAAIFQEYVAELLKYSAHYKISPRTVRTNTAIPDTNLIGLMGVPQQ